MVSSGSTGVVGARSGGVVRLRTLTPLDVEVLRFLLRFTYVRGHHVAGWTGASPYTVQERLTLLSEMGMVRKRVQSVDLIDKSGQIVQTIAHTWECTPKGASLVGEWVVPGTGGKTVTLPAPKPSHLMAHHILGVADLAVWYRRSGLEVAGEREILSLERPSSLPNQAARKVYSYWTVRVPGRMGVHPPDLGAVDTFGGQWAVELERAQKTEVEYADVIAAYGTAGIGQVWHVLSRVTWERLIAASARCGVTWGPSPARGVNVSSDGLLRVQGWRPGRTGLSAPSTWRNQWPATTPGALPALPEPPDLSKSWRRGRIVDPEEGAY